MSNNWLRNDEDKRSKFVCYFFQKYGNIVKPPHKRQTPTLEVDEIKLGVNQNQQVTLSVLIPLFTRDCEQIVNIRVGTPRKTR